MNLHGARSGLTAVLLAALTFSLTFANVGSIGTSSQMGISPVATASASSQFGGSLFGVPLLSASPSNPSVAPFLDRPVVAAANQSREQDIRINEVELNPPSSGSPWVELYNPTSRTVSLANYTMQTINSTLLFAQSPSLAPGGFYVQFIPRNQVSNIADMMRLSNSSGAIVSKTPLLIDRFHDARTWQAVPDGSDEWEFANQTMGRSNGPSVLANSSNPAIPSTVAGNPPSNSTALCSGSAGCAVGTIIRVAGPNSLYLQLNNTIYKVQLALVSSSTVPNQAGRSESAVSILETYCLGNSALIDQDDGNPTSGDSIVAAVYCSGLSMNEQLLHSGSALLDKSQCSVSEFAARDWAKLAGC